MILEAYDFRDLLAPSNTQPIGIASLVQKYNLEVPVKNPCAVSVKSIFNNSKAVYEWQVFDKKYTTNNTDKAHIMFALRNETIDLLFMKRFFEAVGPEPIEEWVKDEPTGSVSRKVWFLYEFLIDKKLDIPDSTVKAYADILDAKTYFTTKGDISTRHRIRNNLLGTKEFCPIVRKTAKLSDFVGSRWDTQAKDQVGKINPAIVARAASFMLLADSQASYQIEGERPPRHRLERWMKVVSQSGRREVTPSELERLQLIVVEGDEFITPGLRKEGGFIGSRDHENNPMPEFVSAKHEDVPELLAGILDANKKMADANVDSVIQAAITSFGFVFVHPFEDGNGRLHRYLMHHVLAENNFTPKGVTFPISSVLLNNQEEYADNLRAFSSPLLPYIEWAPTPGKNVVVNNETADLYRYGDYTEIAEFMYGCVAKTISEDMPREMLYLKCYDEAKSEVTNIIEMPDNTFSLLLNFVRQNDGKLAKRRREKEFAVLTDEDVSFIENTIADCFEPIDNPKSNHNPDP